jgi:hypothetical protein
MLPRDEPLEPEEAEAEAIDAELIPEDFHGDDLDDPDLPTDGADLSDAARAAEAAARDSRLASEAESTAAEGCAYPESIVTDAILSHDVALRMGLSPEPADEEDYIYFQFKDRRATTNSE